MPQLEEGGCRPNGDQLEGLAAAGAGIFHAEFAYRSSQSAPTSSGDTSIATSGLAPPACLRQQHGCRIVNFGPNLSATLLRLKHAPFAQYWGKKVGEVRKIE